MLHITVILIAHEDSFSALFSSQKQDVVHKEVSQKLRFRSLSASNKLSNANYQTKKKWGLLISHFT